MRLRATWQQWHLEHHLLHCLLMGLASALGAACCTWKAAEVGRGAGALLPQQENRFPLGAVARMQRGCLMRLRGGQEDALAGGVSSQGEAGKSATVKVPKSYARRDLLLKIQDDAQRRWEEEKIFEEDSPEDAVEVAGVPGNKSKYFATFPYPYMNGLLHLGHAFSLTKAEFAVGYQRMQGKQCLWPFAFHCTGMPIQAAADTLQRELLHADAEGEAPLADGVAGNEEERDADAGAVRYQSGKSKIAAKRGNAKTQAEVLLSMGVPGEEIAEFRNAEKWLGYFPSLAREDLKAMGLKIDWRRTFITTEASPWYDAFVRWQFRKLKELEKVKFGKRLSIFSPRDRQICADHDRAVGEGVCPQEYTLIKMRLISSIAALSDVQELRDAEIYLLAATLRPETMYGQTNCWVLPHDKEGNDVYYGCYRTHVAGEIAIMSEQAAVNMAYQSLSPSFGKAELVCRVKGADLLGLEVTAPLSLLKVVRTLPLLTISMGKGTGIVTCVPSDAPDDFAALADLQRKAPLREKYNIDASWVLDLAPIPVIESVYKHDAANSTAGTTRCVAEEACKEYKVASQNDRAQLALAKEKAYKLGFYEGTMVIGHLAGVKVEQAKPLIRDKLVEEGHAYIYAEPEKEVTSRSGDKCVVALTDQWYLTYGEPVWQAQVAEHLENTCEMYSADTRSRFAQVRLHDVDGCLFI